MWHLRADDLHFIAPFSLYANRSNMDCKAVNSQIDHRPRHHQHEFITIAFCLITLLIFAVVATLPFIVIVGYVLFGGKQNDPSNVSFADKWIHIKGYFFVRMNPSNLFYYFPCQYPLAYKFYPFFLNRSKFSVSFGKRYFCTRYSKSKIKYKPLP